MRGDKLHQAFSGARRHGFRFPQDPANGEERSAGTGPYRTVALPKGRYPQCAFANGGTPEHAGTHGRKGLAYKSVPSCGHRAITGRIRLSGPGGDRRIEHVRCRSKRQLGRSNCVPSSPATTSCCFPEPAAAIEKICSAIRADSLLHKRLAFSVRRSSASKKSLRWEQRKRLLLKDGRMNCTIQWPKA